MTSLEKTVRDIKEFRVQGANQIAIYGLKFLRQFAKKNGFKLKFETAAYFLEEARPTAVVLHNCIEKLKKSRKLSTIDDLIRTIGKIHEKEARYSDKFVKDGTRIMTYCHSGEAMSFIKHTFQKHKKKISVIVCETGPLEQGIRTVRELRAAKIPVTLIGDNAAGFFMKDVDMVVVGADGLRKDGLVNKVGTSLIAQAAKSKRKPFYVIASTLKIDKRKKFKIEERPAKEIYRKLVNKKNLKGVRIRNPAFDITPWKYITSVITEKGIIKPENIFKKK